jgi:trimeric autotransporter adhesin
VNALASDGERVFVGGDFEFLSPPSGSFVLFSAGDGRPVPGTVAVAGSGAVEMIVPDGSGGWFLAGSFTFVAGAQCPGLAHVRADQTLDRRFCLQPDGAVLALARSGPTLYVGGHFTRFAGRKRLRLAAVDARTAALRAWNPGATGKPQIDFESIFPSVQALAASSSAIYVGGSFQRVGSAARENLVALDPRTGRALPWTIDFVGNGYELRYLQQPVTNLALSGDTLLVGGSFERIAGQQRPGSAAVDARSAALEPWIPPDGPIATTEEALYVASSRGVLALDPRTGRTMWRVPPASYGGFDVSALAFAGTTLYVGGDGAEAEGGRSLASIDLRSRDVTGWRPPNLNGPVVALAAARGEVAVGGDFEGIGDRSPHRDLVALDAETGRPVPLNLDLQGQDTEVRALAVSGSTLYVAGYFDRIAGEPRTGLAAIDLETGRPTTWAPVVENGLQRMAVTDTAVYVSPEGDNYETFGELPLSATDPETAEPLDWRAAVENLGDRVKALVVAGSRVYLAGHFRWVNGERRRGLAAVDAETGELLPWNPRPNGDEGAITVAISDGTLYVGGDFTRIAGARRYRVAAFDAETGELLEWAPRLQQGDLGYGPEAHAFAVTDAAVFIAGDFSSLAGAPREGLAAVDPETGRPLPWRVDLDTNVGYGASHLTIAGSTLYLAGEFESVNGVPQRNLAAVRLDGR